MQPGQVQQGSGASSRSQVRFNSVPKQGLEKLPGSLEYFIALDDTHVSRRSLLTTIS